MRIKSRIGQATNLLLERWGYRLVSRDRLYAWQAEPGVYFHTFSPVALPPEAIQYLTDDSPRLRELRVRYASFARSVTEPLVWTAGFVRPEDLRFFRGDNAYVWQLRGRDMNPLGYALTAYYVKSIDALGLLDLLTEDDAFGVFGFSVSGRTMSRDLLDSVNELNFLEKELGIARRPLKVLDIGAGYGRLAHRTTSWLARDQVFYFCADAVPESTFLCEYYLRFRGVDRRARAIPLDEVEATLASQAIDLAVNVHSFSECSADAIAWWLRLLERHRVQHLLVVPNASSEGGRALVNHAGQDFGAIVAASGYRLVKAVPKYADPLVQEFGIAPTYYHLFERR